MHDLKAEASFFVDTASEAAVRLSLTDFVALLGIGKHKQITKHLRRLRNQAHFNYVFFFKKIMPKA